MKTLFRLTKLVLPLLPVLCLAIIFGSLGSICAISIPLLGVSAIFYKFPLYILFIAGILRGILHYAEQYCNHFIAFTLLARIRSIVFKKLRNLGPAKIECKEKGSLIQLITSDIELLEVFYAHTLSPICIAITVSLASCLLLSTFNIYLALLAGVFYLLVAAGIPLLIGKKAEKTATEYRKDFSDMNSLLLDTLRGLVISILYGQGEKKLAKLNEKSDFLSREHRKMSRNEGLNSLFSALFVSLAGIAMLILSIILYRHNLITFSQALISITLMFSSFGPCLALANLSSGLSQTIASGKRVLSLLDEKALVEEIKGGKEIYFTGAKADKINFSYSEKEEILQNLSMDFEKGKIIGIQGKSGSGKSTLLKLFMHFWEVSSGKISLSETDIRHVNSSNLKKIESYISQETVLFHDTIRENIRLARLEASDEEIEEACRKAEIHDLIESLPEGYESKVSELGENFSSGERQRLGLARIFLHQGDFILLDEPTSNLDSYNEKAIMDTVKAESEGKTIVIVSHRDSTFIHADKIYKLQTGRKS